MYDWWLGPPRLPWQDMNMLVMGIVKETVQYSISTSRNNNQARAMWMVKSSLQWELLHRATDWYGRILSESGQPRWPQSCCLKNMHRKAEKRDYLPIECFLFLVAGYHHYDYSCNIYIYMYVCIKVQESGMRGGTPTLMAIRSAARCREQAP